MTEKTKIAIQNILDNYQGKELSYDVMNQICRRFCTTWNTVRKYTKYMQRIEQKLTEYTLDEVLEKLNACAGEDCYYGSWDFRQIDGKIYDVESYMIYTLMGWKEGV